jgi:hypothetical protein
MVTSRRFFCTFIVFVDLVNAYWLRGYSFAIQSGQSLQIDLLEFFSRFVGRQISLFLIQWNHLNLIHVQIRGS